MARVKIPEYFTDDERKTAERFIEMTKGINSHEVAKALNALHTGSNWSGCSKSDMVSFIQHDNKRKNRHVDLDELEKLLPSKD